MNPRDVHGPIAATRNSILGRPQRRLSREANSDPRARRRGRGGDPRPSKSHALARRGRHATSIRIGVALGARTARRALSPERMIGLSSDRDPG